MAVSAIFWTTVRGSPLRKKVPIEGTSGSKNSGISGYVPSDYFLRHVREISAGQSTPLAQQVGASRSPLLRKRALSPGLLLAPRGPWPRLLSLGTYPPVATYKANAS